MSALILCFFILVSQSGFSSLVPAYGQGQNISITSSFQSKVNIIDNIPSQKATVGDIEIAYKQLGESGAKPIILITAYHGYVESPFIRAANLFKLLC
ncbi:MAG: hypothetical protein QN732_10475, partial [Nitrososphaeraceae archaeon]|nr:hypothetical protein [Nitrososphaeraceae archaeon]